MRQFPALDHRVHSRTADAEHGRDLPYTEQAVDAEYDWNAPNRRPRFGAIQSVSRHSVRQRARACAGNVLRIRVGTTRPQSVHQR